MQGWLAQICVDRKEHRQNTAAVTAEHYAMNLQSHVLRDGEWVAETVDVQNVLKSQAPKPAKKPTPAKAPKCGLLTRTVVQTELANYILPVRLRSPTKNDVAFVGVGCPCRG